MRKKIFSVLFVVMVSFLTLLMVNESALCFEEDLLNLTVPTGLEPRDLLIEIRHRFYGPANEDTGDTAFGMDGGANVNLGFRFLLLSTLELNASRTGLRKEKNAGMSYALKFRYIAFQANVNYFSFTDEAEKDHSGYFGTVSVDTVPIFGLVKPVLNAGYDQLNNRYGVGAGLSITLVDDFLFLQGEVFPYPDNTEIKEYDLSFEEVGLRRGPVYCGGFMIQTSGHHFKLFISNTYETGNRRLMMGTALDKPFLGFVIQRRFGF